MHWPWVDVNGADNEEFEFEECQRLSFDPHRCSFTSNRSNEPQSSDSVQWLLKTAFHERESNSKLMLRHVFMLHEQAVSYNI